MHSFETQSPEGSLSAVAECASDDDYGFAGEADPAYFDLFLRYTEHMFNSKIVIVVPRALASCFDYEDFIRVTLLRLRFDF